MSEQENSKSYIIPEMDNLIIGIKYINHKAGIEFAGYVFDFEKAMGMLSQSTENNEEAYKNLLDASANMIHIARDTVINNPNIILETPDKYANLVKQTIQSVIKHSNTKVTLDSEKAMNDIAAAITTRMIEKSTQLTPTSDQPTFLERMKTEQPSVRRVIEATPQIKYPDWETIASQNAVHSLQPENPLAQIIEDHRVFSRGQTLISHMDEWDTYAQNFYREYLGLMYEPSKEDIYCRFIEGAARSLIAADAMREIRKQNGEGINALNMAQKGVKDCVAMLKLHCNFNEEQILQDIESRVNNIAPSIQFRFKRSQGTIAQLPSPPDNPEANL